jgi:hypothetical protein
MIVLKWLIIDSADQFGRALFLAYFSQKALDFACLGLYKPISSIFSVSVIVNPMRCLLKAIFLT